MVKRSSFRKMYRYFKRQIHFAQNWQPVVVVLWAMETYLYRQFPCYGHLWLNSPTTHSGKPKLLNVLGTVCFKPPKPSHTVINSSYLMRPDQHIVAKIP